VSEKVSRKTKKQKLINVLGTIFEWKSADGRHSHKKLRDHEKKKIKRDKPILNKSDGGEGRTPRKKKG
jgi:hypothetical protein